MGAARRLQQAPDNFPMFNRSRVSSMTASTSDSGGPSVNQCSPSKHIRASRSWSSLGAPIGKFVPKRRCYLGWLHTRPRAARSATVRGTWASSSREAEGTFSVGRDSSMALTKSSRCRERRSSKATNTLMPMGLMLMRLLGCRLAWCMGNNNETP